MEKSDSVDENINILKQNLTFHIKYNKKKEKTKYSFLLNIKR